MVFTDDNNLIEVGKKDMLSNNGTKFCQQNVW